MESSPEGKRKGNSRLVTNSLVWYRVEGKGKSYQLIPRLLYIFTRGWLRIKLINPQQSKAWSLQSILF